MRYRGIIHFHSKYSVDSLTSMEEIINEAAKHELNFMILTDHDSIEGSVRLREIVRRRKLNVEIPLAAEYKLDCGDVIAAFIEREITARTLMEFQKEVRDQNGIILFPHPFQHHKQIDDIAECADMIEVFNSRQTVYQDQQALALASEKRKPTFWASDAHRVVNLSNVILEFDQEKDLKFSLLNSTIHPVCRRKSSAFDFRVSQAIKNFRKRQWIRFFAFPILLARDIVKHMKTRE
jgi:predicted metal-dependent phosphoesterase TrpH